MSKTALVLVADGAEEIEVIIPADVLQRCDVDVTIAGVGSMEPMGGHHVPLRAECLLEDCGEIMFDAVIVPGGGKGSENLHKSDLVTSTIRRHFAAGKIIAAICAAPPVVLGPMGILAGKHVTCFPGLERRLPADAIHLESKVAVDGNIVTSRGPGTAFEFAFRLAELLAGAPKALKVRENMLVSS